jgi:hypothetical protein
MEIIDATPNESVCPLFAVDEKCLVTMIDELLSFLTRRCVNMITRFTFDFWFGRSTVVDIPPPSFTLERISDPRDERAARAVQAHRSSLKFGAFFVTLFLSPEEHPHADSRKALLCVRRAIDVPQPMSALDMLSGCGSQDVFFTIQLGIASHKSLEETVIDGNPTWIPLDDDPSNNLSAFEIEFSERTSIAKVVCFRKKATGTDVRLASFDVDLWDAVRLERNDVLFANLSSIKKMRQAFEGVDAATAARVFQGEPVPAAPKSLLKLAGRAMGKFSKGLLDVIKKKRETISASADVTPPMSSL